MSESPAQTWLTAEQAMKRLGKSRATLYRLVNLGEIQSKEETRPGRKPERLFSSVDIDRALKEKIRISPLPQIARAPQVRPLLTAAATPHAPRPVLRLEEAAAEFGLPQSYLSELIHSKAIAAVKRGAWYLSRKSLERFIDNGFSQV